MEGGLLVNWPVPVPDTVATIDVGTVGTGVVGGWVVGTDV